MTEPKYSNALTTDLHSEDINAAMVAFLVSIGFISFFSEYVFRLVVGLQFNLLSIHTNYREAMVLPNASTKDSWYMSTEFLMMANVVFTIFAPKRLQSLLPHLKDNPVASLL